MGQHRKGLQHTVLAFISEFRADRGYPPTYEEIQRGVHLSSKSHVDYYVKALSKAGLLEQTPNTSRGFRVPEGPPPTFSVPLKGVIAAGEPVRLGDEPDAYEELTRDIADPRKNLYALEVEGYSMVDALVADGDLIIVEHQDEIPNGQMAVVHLRESNEATLKKVYLEGDRVRLQPAHPTMAALYADAEDVEIQGRVVAIIRRLA